MRGVKSGLRAAPDPAVGGTRPPPAAEPVGPAAPATAEGDFGETPGRAPLVGPVVVADRVVGRLTQEEAEEFRQIWRLFLRMDRAWPEACGRWLARGGVAPFVLSENLVRVFLAVSQARRRTELNWIAVTARQIGEPAVGYFVNVLILDAWPLKEPRVIRDSQGNRREITVWLNDDLTRQDASLVLAAIGEPAVAALAAGQVLRAPVPSARRFAMQALGRIGSDSAVDALGRALRASEWQDRAAAAKGLGLALIYRRNERARPVLEAARNDPDEFVRRKVAEALAGKTRSDY